jgi:hypothetical protein
MGAPDRFEFRFTKFLGLGIGVESFPYSLSISLVLPFLCIDIGLGKAYTD